jgi:hypothetical protein
LRAVEYDKDAPFFTRVPPALFDSAAIVHGISLFQFYFLAIELEKNFPFDDIDKFLAWMREWRFTAFTWRIQIQGCLDVTAAFSYEGFAFCCGTFNFESLSLPFSGYDSLKRLLTLFKKLNHGDIEKIGYLPEIVHGDIHYTPFQLAEEANAYVASPGQLLQGNTPVLPCLSNIFAELDVIAFIF